MAKVLLVDTNFSSAPIYRALRAEGHDVHVVGGNPSDCLAKQSTHYWPLDYSDTAALTTLVEDQAFDYLVPGCTDRSYESCVTVGRGRFPGIDAPDAATTINHKGRFRRVASSLGLCVPAVFDDAESACGRDVIVKPVDAFSGKGVSVLRCATPEMLVEANALARSASPTQGALMEEYVEGQLYSHSAFLFGRKVHRDFLVREDSTTNRFVVDTSRVLLPDDYVQILSVLRASVETLAEHLGLQDGLLHTQFIARDSRLWLIEMTRRCPGDLYSQLIELSTGFAYARNYAQPFLGQPLLPEGGDAFRAVMRHTITVSAAQPFDHVRFLKPVEIERLVTLSLVGDALQPSPRSRIAVMFCRAPNQAALDELYAATLRRQLYQVEAGSDPVAHHA